MTFARTAVIARRSLALLCGLAGLFGAGAGSAAPVETIVQLPSENGGVTPYLLSVDDSRRPEAAAVLFTGGAGEVGLLDRGVPRPGRNFLVRTRLQFVERGIATAVIDAPSDVRSMPDSFRVGARHARDVAAVVADLGQRLPGIKVFLVGTSRGTVSAAYAGAALGDKIAGVVLSSSLFNASRGGVGLAGFDYATIRAPLLLVHHTDDTCPVTPYGPASRLGATYPLISVSGGAPPRSEPCEAFAAHGYYGVEAPTVAAIAAWMLGREFPRQVP